jgi:hypothetical protein
MDLDAHYRVVDSFFEGARALRKDYERRFGERVPPFDPSRYAWEYWHVPGQFAQHRAPARAVFDGALLDRFEARLRAWAARSLGLSALGSPPWVSFVLHGDYQGVHRDTPNGVFAFTFGLSRPGRIVPFRGGETLLARPELLDYWRRGGAREETSDEPLFEEIPSLFNRLVAFDARIPHAVRAVEGPRDPRDGRVALQGWLKAEGCIVQGTADRAAVSQMLRETVGRVPEAQLTGAAGLLTLKLDVSAKGHVKRATELVNTLVAVASDASAASRAARVLAGRLGRLRLPPTGRPLSLIVPVLVDDGAVHGP